MVTSSEGWSLSNKGHWIAKDRFEWRNISRFFCRWRIKLHLGGTGYERWCILRNCKNKTRLAKTLLFQTWKLSLRFLGASVLWLFTMSLKRPLQWREVCAELCVQRGTCGQCWLMKVCCLHWWLISHLQADFFPQKDSTGVCDMWDSLLGEGPLSANC